MSSPCPRTPMPRRPGSALRQADVARRAVLAAAGALALSACLATDQGPPPKPDPDLRLRRQVARQVADLAAAFAAAVSAHPALAATLAPLEAEHHKHVSALVGPPAARSSSASPSASATAPPRVPPTPAATLDWLTGLERKASARRRTQSLDASPALARLLASIGACEAGHATLLKRAAR